MFVTEPPCTKSTHLQYQPFYTPSSPSYISISSEPIIQYTFREQNAVNVQISIVKCLGLVVFLNFWSKTINEQIDYAELHINHFNASNCTAPHRNA